MSNAAAEAKKAAAVEEQRAVKSAIAEAKEKVNAKSHLKMLFVRRPNFYYLERPSSGDTIALSVLETKRVDSADTSTFFVPDVDWSAKNGSKENICSAVSVNRINCLLHDPILCDWNDKLWLHCMHQMIEGLCDIIFEQSLLPFFAVSGSEANGKIVQLLETWGWKRLV